MIAALYVQKGGCYYGLPDVDPWDEERDARLYAGPHPVVAHPPCATWGRMAESAFGKHFGDRRGKDGGCFAAAIAAVRKYGGVLEHPDSSSAWRAFGLIEPNRAGGWIAAGDFQGWTCCIEQGHYGHKTRKATWLYAAKVNNLPSLQWGASWPDGYVQVPGRGESYTRLSKRQRAATPIPFRDLLLNIARSAKPASLRGAA